MHWRYIYPRAFLEHGILFLLRPHHFSNHGFFWRWDWLSLFVAERRWTLHINVDFFYKTATCDTLDCLSRGRDLVLFHVRDDWPTALKRCISRHVHSHMSGSLNMEWVLLIPNFCSSIWLSPALKQIELLSSISVTRAPF